jgi:hypothetical protein
MQSMPNTFWNWFSKCNAEDVSGMLAIGGSIVVGAIAVICLTIYKIQRGRADDELKRELLDRGLGASEIATIISAKSSKILRGRD